MYCVFVPFESMCGRADEELAPLVCAGTYNIAVSHNGIKQCLKVSEPLQSPESRLKDRIIKDNKIQKKMKIL